MTAPVDAPEASLVIAAVEAAGIGHALTDERGVVLFTSPQFEAQTGVRATDESAAQPWFLIDYSSHTEKDAREAAWAEFLAKGERWQGIVRWQQQAASPPIYFEGTAIPLNDGRILLITNDSTERVTAKSRQAANERRQSEILDALPLSVCVCSPLGTVSYINQLLPRRLGREPSALIGQPLSQAFPKRLAPLLGKLFDKTLAAGGIVEETDILVADGPLADSHWLGLGQPLLDREGELEAILLIAVDCSLIKRLERERARLAATLAETQKISLLNDFAGGLSHELANLFHPIAAYARLLSADVQGPNAETYATKINQATLAAGQVLRRTLSLNQQETDDEKTSRVGDVVNEALELARTLAPPQLTFDASGTETEFTAACAPGALRQVIINLLNNAADAMAYRGEIRIEMRGGLPDPDDPDISPAGSAPFVSIAVIDRGAGMAADVRAHIFEPFFTTKPNDRGTGLGLVVVQSLVKGWGGTVAVETAPGTGTTMTVWIPQVQASREPL